MRNEAYLAYAAVTKNEAQRSIRPFYEPVILHRHRLNRKELISADENISIVWR
ncbi:MAG: hypothetical protein ABRQ34_09980 [Smithellaceae bacterium]